VATRTEAYAQGMAFNDEIRAAQQKTTRTAKAFVRAYGTADVASAMREPLTVRLPGSVVDGLTVEAWRFQCAQSVWPRLQRTQRGSMGCDLVRLFRRLSEDHALSVVDFLGRRSDASLRLT
jgi:hypothetical protein